MPFDHSVAQRIDHTILRPEATRSDVRRVCDEARRFGFASVCVNGFWTPFVAAELRGSAVKVCTVAGFPLGACATAVKVAETRTAIDGGASEIDMVLNAGAFTGGEADAAEADIRAVVEAAHEHGAIVKAILETALLTRDQKIEACRRAVAAGADFVKTSTGFARSGATAEDVALMRETVGPHIGVKASGGVRTLEDFRAMVAAGASRIGSSASVAIVEATV